jgi:dTMP kinase
MYIVFEGIVGSGKTTQVQKLVEYFKSLGRDVVSVREPGSTQIAEDIRYLAQTKEWEGETMHPLTNAYLYAAARAQTLETVVKPALESGKIVISDRSFLSSCVIQGEAQWLSMERVLDINLPIVRDTLPDIVLYLEVDIGTALGRTFDDAWDKFEREGRDFYEAITRGYEKCKNLDIIWDRFVTIDARGSEEEVFGEILNQISI